MKITPYFSSRRSILCTCGSKNNQQCVTCNERIEIKYQFEYNTSYQGKYYTCQTILKYCLKYIVYRSRETK